MKNTIIPVFIFLISGTAFLTGKVAPLTEKIWSNPEFIKDYLGSFAISSEVEPKIGRAEQVLFEDITEMIDDNRTDEVIEELKGEFDEIDSSPAIDFTLANFLVQEGNMTESIKYYVSAIRKFPDFLRARKNLGLIYVQDGNFSEALPHLVKCVELGGGRWGPLRIDRLLLTEC